MALIACRECKAQISTDAKACPQCGAKPSGGMSVFTAALILVVIAGVLASLGDHKETPPAPQKTEAQKLADAAREREFQTVVAGAKWIKGTMKKPETFELLSALMIDGKVICYEYKARNSWNDVREGYRVITDDVNSDEPKVWNKHCANKTGTDYSHARIALQ